MNKLEGFMDEDYNQLKRSEIKIMLLADILARADTIANVIEKAAKFNKQFKDLFSSDMALSIEKNHNNIDEIVKIIISSNIINLFTLHSEGKLEDRKYKMSLHILGIKDTDFHEKLKQSKNYDENLAQKLYESYGYNDVLVTPTEVENLKQTVIDAEKNYGSASIEALEASKQYMLRSFAARTPRPVKIITDRLPCDIENYYNSMIEFLQNENLKK